VGRNGAVECPYNIERLVPRDTFEEVKNVTTVPWFGEVFCLPMPHVEKLRQISLAYPPSALLFGDKQRKKMLEEWLVRIRFDRIGTGAVVAQRVQHCRPKRF